MVKWVLATSLVVGTCVPHIAYAQPQPQRSVPQGKEWVAFDADYTSASMNGRYYRASDGSMRQEGAAPDGSKAFIFIVNVARKETYFYTSHDNTWRVSPVVVPVEGYRPFSTDPLFSNPSRLVRNVQLRPQSDELFVPPTGVTLVRNENPLILVERIPAPQ